MSPVIPFRCRSSLPGLLIALGAVAAAVIGFAASTTFMNWQSKPGTQISVENARAIQSSPIEVIDGDTVRFEGAVYRLVGIDTPERGDKARCDDERRRAEAATTRLRALIGSADARTCPISRDAT
jgi:endonuclease YncB( thermonuclease family)